MLLLDENLSYRLAPRLNDIYPGIIAARTAGLLGKKDPDVWKYATENNLTIVTKDGEDMKDLQRRFGHPPKIIILTLGNCRIAAIEKQLRNRQAEIAAFLDNERRPFLVI
ncbi:DUF5615 family PIN-like protein [Microbulbifer sp. 2205BS26-8]|uniref:DUF5615 family PIN-like protein n=1 Tax=Microbulbifer sp. 2205BS26-8 TaxID=3064386 RepID=UPI00273F4599|nr:DUF5615 family PIN-like protein [Microbulbifer sp. 2205BS26-8]MDP5210964.1 DUF5615 family PIN-like protein [Microbulbifer sp. 2205BS26-8]